MKKDQKTTAQLLEAWKNGEFVADDRATQIAAGWYDWFCHDTSLAAKTKRLYAKAAKVIELDRASKSPKIDPDKTYIWFKNNCPLMGHLYDDFRIADLETGDVLFTVVPSSGHDSCRGISEVWGASNGFVKPIVTGTWKDVLAYFKGATGVSMVPEFQVSRDVDSLPILKETTLEEFMGDRFGYNQGILSNMISLKRAIDR